MNDQYIIRPNAKEVVELVVHRIRHHHVCLCEKRHPGRWVSQAAFCHDEAVLQHLVLFDFILGIVADGPPVDILAAGIALHKMGFGKIDDGNQAATLAPL